MESLFTPGYIIYAPRDKWTKNTQNSVINLGRQISKLSALLMKLKIIFFTIFH
uniref:Uncharacterized protein n=1 Tax=viral metagenome TaxID=1070528 RepID=A0A6C0J7Q6_9ZZZZ